MANAKEIQKRMKSIQDTMKITSAMYMISSAKLRTCKAEACRYRAVFLCDIQSAISRMLRHMPDAESTCILTEHEEIPDDERRRRIHCRSLQIRDWQERTTTTSSKWQQETG